MIYKIFKQKSYKKHLNDLVSKRRLNVFNDKIESLGVIINIDEACDFDWFKTFDTFLKIHPNKLKIIAFSKKEQAHLNTWDVCYSPKNIGWNGVIKHVELQSFLATPFDVLISYYTQDILELKLLTTQSKAKFKIGILQTDTRINDLIIKTTIREFDVFKAEVFKYLMILNKIKNE